MFADSLPVLTGVHPFDDPDVIAGQGTIAVGGQSGAHAGYGMRRGSVIFATTPVPADLPATFVPAIAAADVFWQLLARDLARHGGPFAALASMRCERHLGDLAAGGKGEMIFVR